MTMTTKRTMTPDSGQEAIKILERRIPVFCNWTKGQNDTGLRTAEYFTGGLNNIRHYNNRIVYRRTAEY
jgi:hypothetical protein